MSTKKFVLVTFLTLLLFNLARIIGVRFFAQTDFWNRTISDKWHHYQLGILFLLVAFLIFRKRKRLRDLILAVGSGMVIDESMYLFYPLNPSFNHYTALGVGFEFLVFVIFSLAVFKLKSTKS